jgi:hypothetical protein
MIKGFIFFFVILFAVAHEYESYQTLVGAINISDTVTANIYQVKDSLGLPLKYKARIVTPVCETDKCYIIEIIIYWDLIGRYCGYDTIPGQGLTKLDHIPFSEKDYRKLNDILSDRNSLLASYSKENLVSSTRSSEIDGFTGATDQAIKESVISGGVYSCYALWHIANGDAKDTLRKVTFNNLNSELVQKMTKLQDQEVNYFLINSFSHADFNTYLPQVLTMIADGQGYFAKNAIEKIPPEIMADPRSLQFFSANFEGLDYFTQVALLKKLDLVKLSQNMINTLNENLNERDSYKNELIKQLLMKGNYEK